MDEALQAEVRGHVGTQTKQDVKRKVVCGLLRKEEV